MKSTWFCEAPCLIGDRTDSLWYLPQLVYRPPWVSLWYVRLHFGLLADLSYGLQVEYTASLMQMVVVRA